MLVLALAGLLLAVPPASGQEPSARAATINEIRVHGNYRTPESEVLRLAGLVPGQTLERGSIEQARTRLQQSGRFLAVDVRERYRSLDDPTDVAIVILVKEHPGTDAAASAPGALQRTFRGVMFLPVLDFADGYGFTYGGRASFVDGFGNNARLSVPLTWGGTRQAAAEFRKTLAHGAVETISATASISERTNPHYDIDDGRREASVGASRKIAGPLRAEGHFGLGGVTFGTVENRMARYGAGLTLDTRADPVFPRNALFVTAAWERMHFSEATPGFDGLPIDRLRVEARGYIGVVGQAVVSLRAQYGRANRPLPPWERFLLGGADSLRGYRAGTFAGDSLAAASAELRVPLSSPLSFARMGVDAFVDVGTAWDVGSSLRDAPFHPGFGGGGFFAASIFQINADVAVRPTGDVRLHVTSGFRF